MVLRKKTSNCDWVFYFFETVLKRTGYIGYLLRVWNFVIFGFYIFIYLVILPIALSTDHLYSEVLYSIVKL